jgi:hypothetical protein
MIPRNCISPVAVLCSQLMNELDAFWSEELARAAANAKDSGRHSVADYLELRAQNDVIRSIGVRWLTEAMIAVAGEFNRRSHPVEIEREDPHRFTLRGATMSGTLLRLRQGVRCLTVEAGWTRTPSDGFMRGGALAAARLTHFGMPRSGAELGLYADPDAPRWRIFIDGQPAGEFTALEIERHFNTLLT